MIDGCASSSAARSREGDWRRGVVVAPYELDGDRDLRQLRLVGLVHRVDEDVAHDTRRGAVVLDPARRWRASIRSSLRMPTRCSILAIRNESAGAGGAETRSNGTPASINPTTRSGNATARWTATRPPKECPATTTGASISARTGASAVAYSAAPQTLWRRRRRAEPREVDRERVEPAEHLAEVGSISPPAVQREDLRGFGGRRRPRRSSRPRRPAARGARYASGTPGQLMSTQLMRRSAIEPSIGAGADTSIVVRHVSFQRGSSSRILSNGPMSATSSTIASGTAAIVSALLPAR